MADGVSALGSADRLGNEIAAPDLPKSSSAATVTKPGEPKIVVKDGITYEYFDGDLKTVQNILESQPGIMAAFKGKYISVAVVKDSVAEYPGIDPNERPRGYPRGMTMKDVQAVFYNDKVLIISTKSLGSRSVRDRVFHEAGHAIDYLATSLDGKKASARDEFKGAYNRDFGAIKRMPGHSYFDTNDTRGRSELYAESFRMMLVNRQLLKQELPNVYTYWNKRRW